MSSEVTGLYSGFEKTLIREGSVGSSSPLGVDTASFVGPRFLGRNPK